MKISNAQVKLFFCVCLFFLPYCVTAWALNGFLELWSQSIITLIYIALWKSGFIGSFVSQVFKPEQEIRQLDRLVLWQQNKIKELKKKLSLLEQSIRDEEQKEQEEQKKVVANEYVKATVKGLCSAVYRTDNPVERGRSYIDSDQKIRSMLKKIKQQHGEEAVKRCKKQNGNFINVSQLPVNHFWDVDNNDSIVLFEWDGVEMREKVLSN